MKKLLIIVMMLLLIPLVSAIPPVQIATGDETLLLSYPKFEYVKMNTEYNMSVHAYNATNGLILLNADFSCDLHIYNHSGFQVLNVEMEDYNTHKKFTYIDASAFVVGWYSYEVHCNTTSNGGYASGLFAVTTDGLVPEDSAYGWGIVALLGVAALFLATSFKVDSIVLKSLFFFITMLFVVITLSISLTLPNDSLAMTNMLEIAYLIAATITVFTFIYTIIMFIHDTLVNKNLEVRQEERG